MFAKARPGPRVTVLALSALFFMSLSVNADVDTGVQAYKDEDYPTAYTEFLAAAVAGNAVAQYLVGSMHEDGLGTARDDSAAVRWYERAAKQGDAEGSFALAQMLLSGRGIDRDDKRAANLIRSAADDGHHGAMNALGTLYLQGRTVARSSTDAAKWYKKAGEGFQPDAWYNLAQLYLAGDGVTENPSAALQLYRKAALSGHPGAAVNLAYIYANGLATAPNYIRAYGWLSLARLKQQEVVEANLVILQDRMTDAEIEQGEAFAEELAAEVRRLGPTN